MNVLLVEIARSSGLTYQHGRWLANHKYHAKILPFVMAVLSIDVMYSIDCKSTAIAYPSQRAISPEEEWRSSPAWLQAPALPMKASVPP